jgi:leucyl-tRNA---protein transferase
MADMDIFEFAAMIEETPIRSRVIEYTRQAGHGRTARWCRGLPDRRAR